MKRDMDLIREIMLWLEENNRGEPEIPERTSEEIGYHCHLLMQAGFIKAADSSCMDDELPQAIPLSVTWPGHEFIDSSRDKSIWKSVKEKAMTTTGGVGVAVLTELLKDEAKRRLGLASA